MMRLLARVLRGACIPAAVAAGLAAMPEVTRAMPSAFTGASKVGLEHAHSDIVRVHGCVRIKRKRCGGCAAPPRRHCPRVYFYGPSYFPHHPLGYYDPRGWRIRYQRVPLDPIYQTDE